MPRLQRRLLRGVGAAVLLGGVSGSAFIVSEWEAVYPPAISTHVEGLIDGGHTDDALFIATMERIRRYHPDIATYFEGVAAESRETGNSGSESALDIAAERYSSVEGGSVEGAALVRRARLNLRRGVANRNPTETIVLLERAKDLGSARAAFELAGLYASGSLLARDMNRAVENYKRAADTVPEAAFALASIYQRGAAKAPTGATARDLVARAMWILETRIAETGAAKYMVELADAYQSEAYGQPNYSKAREWLERAADSGSREAQSALAKLYSKPGTEVENLVAARSIFESLAESGDLASIVKTADFRRAGLGGSVDLKGAVSLYKAASEQGSAAAQFRYGLALRTGEGVAADAAKGFALLRSAAEAGNVGAAVAVARIYEYGNGTLRNPAKTLHWYRTAAARGSLQAAERLATAYLRGTFVAADQKSYLDWAQRAIERGSRQPRLKYDVGTALLQGSGLPLDRSRGFSLLIDAAESGSSARAFLAVARCYAFGIGVKQDAGKAVEWYERAAKRGRTVAYWELGRAYASGFGVQMDENLAYEYFLKAASNGNAPAMVDLGRMYITGFGVARDPEMAAEWLQKAAAIGNSNAMIELANVDRERLLEDSSDRRAVDWLNKAIELGNSRAEYIMALLYLSGTVVKRDEKRAELLLTSATAKKNAPAKVRLKALREQQEIGE